MFQKIPEEEKNKLKNVMLYHEIGFFYTDASSQKMFSVKVFESKYDRN